MAKDMKFDIHIRVAAATPVSGLRDMAWTRGGVSSRFRSFAALAEALEARG